MIYIVADRRPVQDRGQFCLALDAEGRVAEDGGMKTTSPTIIKIKNGWLARGDGWAVRADSQEEAGRVFAARERWHAEIDARPARPIPDEDVQSR
jgi:hypothetical protein